MPDRERPLAGERPPKPLTRCYDRRRQALRRPLEPGLAALVAVVDDLTWPPLAYRHLERIQHEFGAQMIGHGPTDDPTAEGIEHHSEVEEARGGGHEGD